MHRDSVDLFAQASNHIDLSSLMSQVGEAIAYADSNWIVRYCNDVYLANVGLPMHEVLGKTPFEYLPAFTRSIFYESSEQCRRDRKPITKIGFSTGLNRWLTVRLFPVGDGVVLFANDASDSIVKTHLLAQNAVRDPLTGLGNKLALSEAIDTASKGKGALSITLVGLARFKAINDVHGFTVGDMALLEIASRLQTSTRPGEAVYRVTGDSFAVLRCGTDAVDVVERAEAFGSAVSAPFSLNGQRFVVGAKIGIAEGACDGIDADELLKHASLALAAAERSALAPIQRYRPELLLASRHRSQIEAELRVALEMQQFTLLLQPKVCLSSGRVLGAEALIRWAHPRRGMVAPGEFLAVAQDAGLMPRLDAWVLRQALRHIGTLKQRGMHMPVSINLSVDSLADVCFVERVRDALAEAAVEPVLLEIEIPEGALMHDVDISATVLKGLSAMGVRVSIDDFGTGYSSLAYLARFPVHALKIDRSFIEDMTRSETGRTIVQTMVRLGHALALPVVAEGAETPQQLTELRAMGCDSVQGFAVARPMPLGQFFAFCAAAHLKASQVDAMSI